MPQLSGEKCFISMYIYFINCTIWPLNQRTGLIGIFLFRFYRWRRQYVNTSHGRGDGAASDSEGRGPSSGLRGDLRHTRQRRRTAAEQNPAERSHRARGRGRDPGPLRRNGRSVSSNFRDFNGLFRQNFNETGTRTELMPK